MLPNENAQDVTEQSHPARRRGDIKIQTASEPINKPADSEQRCLDDKLEEALKETFPASDPVQLSSIH